MMLLVESVAIAVLFGLLTRGSLGQLEHLRIRWGWVFIGGLLLQMVLPRWFSSDGTPASLLVYLCWVFPGAVSSFVALANRKLAGMPLVAAGLALNMAVVASNGGMPVLTGNAELANASPDVVLAQVAASWLHVPTEVGTRVLVLADVIPIPGPQWHRGLASLGDVVLCAGVGLIVFVGMHQAPERSDGV